MGANSGLFDDIGADKPAAQPRTRSNNVGSFDDVAPTPNNSASFLGGLWEGLRGGTANAGHGYVYGDADGRIADLERRKEVAARVANGTASIGDKFDNGFYRLSSLVNGVTPTNADDLIGDADAVKRQAASDISNNAANLAAATPQYDNKLGNWAYGGLQSAVQQAPGLAASLLLKSPAPMVGYGAGTTFFDKNVEAREAGYSRGDASKIAAGHGAIEGVTELLPGKKLFGDLAKNSPLGRMFINQIASDVPGEIVAGVSQSALDTTTGLGGQNKGDWGGFVQQLPDTIGQSAVGSIVGSGTHAAAGWGSGKLLNVGQPKTSPTGGTNAGVFDDIKSTTKPAGREQAMTAAIGAARGVAPNVDTKLKGGGWSNVSPTLENNIANSSKKYGVDLGFMKTIAWIESKGDTGAVSSTGARGIYQFTKGTGKQYGLIGANGDLRHNEAMNVDAAARLARDNARIIGSSEPYMLYMAHQQGAGGVAALLKAVRNGDSADGVMVGKQSLRDNMDVNGGRGKSPSQFLAMWKAKYEKAHANVNGGAYSESSTISPSSIIDTGMDATMVDQQAMMDDMLTEQQDRMGEMVQAQEDAQAALDEKMQVMQDMQDEMDARFAAGNDGEVELDGAYQPTQWGLMEADDLAPTMEKADNQFRDRTRLASELQVDGIANNLDFRKLGDSPMMDYGAPTLNADGKTIIGGNGRVAGIARAYGAGKASAYRGKLEADAGRYGFAPEQVRAMRSPVLVRRFKKFVDTQKAAIASNEGGGLVMSTLEQAKADGIRLPDLKHMQVNEDGNINTVANRDFIRAFIAQLPVNQQAAFVGSDGQLSQQGVARLRNAVLYKAYGDTPQLQRMIESTDQGSKNIANALTQAAPRVSTAKNDIEQGDIHGADISQDMVDAVTILEKIRADGGSLREYLAQLNMFGDDLSIESRKLIQFFNDNIKSATKIREFINAYYDALEAQGSPKQDDIFGDSVNVDKNQLLDKVINERTGQQSDTEAETTAGLERSTGEDSKPTEQRSETQGSTGGSTQESQPAEELSNDTTFDFAGERPSEAAQAAHDEKLRLEAEQADKQDNAPSADGFTLSGSDRDADVAAAHGQESMFSKAKSKTTGNTAATIRAAITKAYGKLLGQLESKGLVTLTQTEDEAIEAAAQARAAKTGQPVEQERATLRASVKNSVADQTQTENFQRWFKDSKVVDADGKPLVVYHGTTADFNAFQGNQRGVHFVSTSKTWVEKFYTNADGTVADGANVMPVYVKASNPFDFENKSHIKQLAYAASLSSSAISQIKQGQWSRLEDRTTLAAIKSLGFDGLYVREDGHKNLAVFDPAQVKSAIGNNGDFDPSNLDIRFSANGSIQGFFDPQTGQSFLIADNLTAEAAPGVLMHEVGIHMAADGSMKALFNRAAMMLKLQRGNPFMKAVQDRMDAAGETSGEEAAAYIAEAYENDRANAPASVQRWLADLLAAVKAWMFKKGIMGADRLTVADIAAVARANAKTLARGQQGVVVKRAMASFSRSESGDQTQTEAFKRWFAGSKVVDAQTGKPLVMYHGTPRSFDVFSNQGRMGRDAIFLTPDPEFANRYAGGEWEMGDGSGTPNVMPVYVSATKVFDYQDAAAAVDALARHISDYMDGVKDPAHYAEKLKGGDWGLIESPAAQVWIKKNYPDGFYVQEAGVKSIAVFRPEQIKSAVGNVGTFDNANNDIRFSKGNNEFTIEPETNDGLGLSLRRGSDNVNNNQSVAQIQSDISQKLGITPEVFARRLPDVTVRENADGLDVPSDAQAYFDPETQKIILIADRIEQGQAFGVFLHEVFHKRGAQLLGDKLPALSQFVQRWKDRPQGSIERTVYDAANSRAEQSGDYDGELVAYAIEEAVAQGVDTDTVRNPVKTFWERAVQAFGDALRKYIPNYKGILSAKELVQMARGAAQLELDGAPIKQSGDGKQYSKSKKIEDGMGYFADVSESSIAHEEKIYRDGKFLDGNGELKLGKAVYEKVAGLVKSESSPLQIFKLIDNKPQSFKKLWKDFQSENSKASNAAVGIHEAGKPFDAMERKLLKEVLTRELAAGVNPPDEVVRIASDMRQLLSQQTDELVALGMLNKDSAERWRDTYLPRFYDKQADLFGSVGQFVKAFKTARSAARIGIDGSHLKGRGIFKSVPKGTESQYEATGWEVRGTDNKGQPVVWRDYTKAERETMGENQDGLMSFTAGYLQTQSDLAKARLYQRVATNDELASKTHREGWVHVPDTNVADTGVKKYGALSGMFVHPEVHDHLNHQFGFKERSALLQTWRKALGYWKATKTVYNPVAHMNNVISNVSMFWMAGGNPADLVRGVRDLAGKKGYYAEALDMGLVGDGTDTGALRDMFGGMASADKNTVMQMLADKAVQYHVGKPVKFLKQKAEAAYRVEDEVFKLSLYRTGRERGLSQEDARDYAESFFFDYSDVSKGVRFLRDSSILPFITYTAKAVPAVTRLALTRPHRVAAFVGLMYGLNALSYAVSGGDEEDEREKMPEYFKGNSIFGIPKLIRLPWSEDNGDPVFIDVSKWQPLGDFADVSNQKGGAPLPNWLMPNGPVLSTYDVFVNNKDPFTGDEFVKSYDSAGAKSKEYAKWMAAQWLPASVGVPFSYHTNNVLDGVRNQFDGTAVADALENMGYTGRKRNGDDVDLSRSAWGSLGIKQRTFSPDEQAGKEARRRAYEAREIRSDMSRTMRDLSITPERKRERLQENKDALRRLFPQSVEDE